MHRAGVSHHIPVYLEKPPTLDYRELETMIQCERAARKASMVGFNFIVEKPRLALKQRQLDGEFGAVLEARLLALSARPIAYFLEKQLKKRSRLGIGGSGVLVELSEDFPMSLVVCVLYAKTA